MRMVRRRGAFAGSVQGSFRSAGGAGRASKVWRPHARPEEAQASSPTFVARGTAAAAPARAAPPRPDGARDGRRGGVLRVPDLPGVGRRGGRRLGGGRAAAADRRGVPGRAGGAARGRRDPGPARDAAGRAAVPVRRALPVPGLDARPGGGHARARPGRRGGALGRRLGAPARRAGGGGAVLGDLDRARRGRRPHRGAVPVPGRRAAAHRRLGRGRGEGDDRLVHQVGVARAGGGPAAARDRGAGRAGGCRAARFARDSAGRDRGVGGGGAGAVRAP